MMTTIKSTHICTHTHTYTPYTLTHSLTHSHSLTHTHTQQCGDIDDDDYDQKLAAAGDDPSIDRCQPPQEVLTKLLRNRCRELEAETEAVPPVKQDMESA